MAANPESQVNNRNSKLYSVANNALKGTAVLWFLTAVAGQWIFVYYLSVHYGGTAIQGDWSAWSEGGPQGIIPGDTLGNISMVMHILLAVIVMFGGPLQLIPKIRSRFPTFHRWNGRTYIVGAIAGSLFGLYMIWTRGSVGATIQHIGTSLDGVLIMVFAFIAVRFAAARNIVRHRRWALRLFMVVSAVWFFRIGLMAWIILNGGPVGMDMETFTGPFLTFWSFGQYLVPLVILELYLRTQDKAGAAGRLAMAAGLLVVTLVMGVGIFGATMGMWLPKVS